MLAAGGGAEGGGDGVEGAGLLGCWVVLGRWMAWGVGEIISAGQGVGRRVGRIMRVEGWGVGCLGIYSLGFETRAGVGGREAFGKEG